MLTVAIFSKNNFPPSASDFSGSWDWLWQLGNPGEVRAPSWRHEQVFKHRGLVQKSKGPRWGASADQQSTQRGNERIGEVPLYDGPARELWRRSIKGVKHMTEIEKNNVLIGQLNGDWDNSNDLMKQRLCYCWWKKQNTFTVVDTWLE